MQNIVLGLSILIMFWFHNLAQAASAELPPAYGLRPPTLAERASDRVHDARALINHDPAAEAANVVIVLEEATALYLEAGCMVDMANVHLVFGMLYFGRNQPGDMQKVIDHSLEAARIANQANQRSPCSGIEPSDVYWAAQSTLAAAYRNMGRLTESTAIFRSAVTYYEHNADNGRLGNVWYRIGVNNLLTKEWVMADAEFRKSIACWDLVVGTEWYGRPPTAWREVSALSLVFLRALVLEEAMGKRSAAVPNMAAELRRQVALVNVPILQEHFPDEVWYIDYSRSVDMRARGKLREAEALLRVLGHDPKQAEIERFLALAARARVLTALGNREEAIATAREAEALFGSRCCGAPLIRERYERLLLLTGANNICSSP